MSGPAAGNGATPQPIYASDATGLGVCLLCLQEYRAGQLQGMPEDAITSSPVLIPVPGGAIPVAVPACYRHALGGDKRGPTLIVAGGMS